MPTLWGSSYTRSDLHARTADRRQLADVRPFEFTDGAERGVRALRVRNAAGLDFTVLADRGLSLYDLTFQGVPLGFLTQVGVTHPAYAEQPGLGWLRTWPGGFLTPCGLTQVGSPTVEDGEELGIHGRLSNLPAGQLQWNVADDGLWVQGVIRETSVFGVNLVMTRRISAAFDQPRVWIDDRVENQGFEAAPLMLLQHFNLGFPLVDAAARLILPPHAVAARDEAARPGLNAYTEFSAPIDGYQEQVFYHDLQADEHGQVAVRLINPAFNGGQGLGVTWRYAKADYPVLAEWKMMRAGFYAVGVEPGNCHVEGRVRERERGTLQMIAPGETRTFKLEVEFSHATA